MKRKVRIIFGTDEESGWEDMKVYFQRESMPDFGVTPDADYPNQCGEGYSDLC